MKKMLVIEDHKEISKLLQDAFYDFEVTVEANGKKGLKKASSKRFDIIILDLNLPEMDGIEICKKLREDPVHGKTPIIMLTARLSIESKLEGFDVGADDYLSKPFEILELQARVKALLERSREDKDILYVQEFKLDKRAKKVYLKDKLLKFSEKEFDLLAYLTEKDGDYATKKELMENVWGNKAEELTFSGTLKYHIFQVRQKLGKNVIKTKSKLGYAIIKK